MEKKIISLLEKQIKKLDAGEFDLEAWKSSAVALLSRIYGEKNQKSELISKLNIDYGSWALRDSKSTYNPMESCKKQGRELLEMSIDEIKTFGVSSINQGENELTIANILEDELKVSQYKKIKNAIKSDSESDLIIEVSKLDETTKSNILAKTLKALDLKDNL